MQRQLGVDMLVFPKDEKLFDAVRKDIYVNAYFDKEWLRCKSQD